MTHTASAYIHKFFADKHGKITIWQTPNALLYSWIAIKLLGFVADSSFASGLSALGTAVLFAWAYLEATQGDSAFRQVLGAVFLIMIIFGFFQI